MHTHLVLYERELVKRWKTLYDSESWGLNKGEGFPGGSAVKNPPANAGDTDSIPWVWKIPWKREWQPAPVFLPGKPHGERSLVGYI